MLGALLFLSAWAGGGTARAAMSEDTPTVSNEALLQSVSPDIRATAHVVAPGIIEFKGGSVRLLYGTAGQACALNAAAEARTTSAQSTTYVHGCPKGSTTKWFCFYEHESWNENGAGRMLQFKDAGLQNLASYGFSDQTTSWVNTTGKSVAVYDSTSRSGWLWSESPGATSSNVGGVNNDRASSFRRS